MRGSRAVLGLGAAFAAGCALALWLTSVDPPLERAAPAPPEAPAIASSTPVRPRAPAAPAPPALPAPPASQGGPVRTAALPPEQWPERLRPLTGARLETPEPSRGDETPFIDKEDIRSAIKGVEPLIKDCFLDAAERYPGDQKVVLRFTIVGQGTSGHFDEGEVVESSIADPWVQACFLDSLTDAQFRPPHGKGKVTVTYPFKFVAHPKDGGT